MQINITPSHTSRISEVDFFNLAFGREFTDHMLICDCIDGQWQTPRILPFGTISFSPGLSALHYGQSLFEGMKAHKDANGKAWLFRPLDNWRRLNISATRLCMAEVPEDIFMEGLKKLITMEKAWIPTHDGSALYVRPFLFATDDCIGVRPSANYRYMVICCPVNPIYTIPLRIKAEDKYVRAVEGGVGYAKAAGNYAGAMLPTREAQEQGFDQIMWLDGREKKYIEESGTMNLFFVIDGKLITPELSRTILDGFTRASIIQLAKDNGIVVEERKISIDEITTLHQEGKLTEAFGTGTAATVSHVVAFNYRTVEYPLLPVEERTVSTLLAKALNDIKTFKAADKHGWMVMAG